MWTLLLVVFATGSPALLQAAPVQGSSGRCRFAGVFHVEGTSRYSLTFRQALELCQSLGYKLATQEQVNEAYKKGLRTCRYGWIDGQNVMFLPHVNGPNCDSSYTDITFRPEAAEYLSDVYCFNLSDASLNCEDTGKSNSEGLTNGNTATANEKPREDILMEVETEGFLVDVEEIMGRVKRETSFLKPSTAPALEEPSATTHSEDKGPTSKPRFGKSSSSVTSSILFPDSEGSGSGMNEKVFEVPKPSPFTMTTITSEAAKGTSMQNNEEKINNKKGRKINASPEGKEDTSAGKEDTSAVKEDTFAVKEDTFAVKEDTSAVKEDTSAGKEGIQKGDGPSTWLIIFAFCVVVGAVVCILAAIATRDKWYGPRQSRNITTEVNKDYSKTETLPLSEKEQEIVALMSVAKLKNGNMEDITATCLDEREKEYLM